MWPTGKSLPPLAQLTSREESCCIVQLVTLIVSNCPHASLNGTQTTIEGKCINESMMCFHSERKLSADSFERVISSPLCAPSGFQGACLSPEGMSCQTKMPIWSQ